MRNLIKIFVFMLVATGTIFANNTPTEGSTLQVLAPSGLKLRSNPSMDAGTIVVMPHGAEVLLLEFEENNSLTRVDWIDGKWIKVNYNGNIGWAFDGFLTILNIPNHELEKCYEDLDLLYPVEFWTRANFGAVKIDTVTDEQTFHIVKYNLVNNQSLRISEHEFSSQLELHLNDVRVMEVYQLIESMIDSKRAKKVFQESSVFIEKAGTINHVKIDIGGGIDIRQSYDGQIRIVINSNYGC